MTAFDVIVWLLDIGLLTRILVQGEIIIRNDKERLELERENHRMAKERYIERSRWRESKRRQQERKVVAPSETPPGTVQSDGTDVAKDI
jgi:hypothetical protein